MAACLLPASIVLALLSQQVVAHGGVVEEDDLCVIKVNYLRAHFKVYQPRISAHKEFCEDLPVAAESVFVMEYQHDALKKMPIDFRIVRDVTGKGRFARLQDIEAINDIDNATVFYQPPHIEPDVYTVVHEFAADGDYIGIVTVTQPDTGKVHVAVFPFEVGYTGIGYWPYVIAVLIVVQLQYLFMSGRIGRFRKRRPTLATSFLLGAMMLSPQQASLADTGEFRVSYTTPAGPPEINRMHHWVLHVETADGEPVEHANIEVSGSMPQHRHGLPTQPRVTAELGGGDYRLDGLRFHMRGYWEIEVTVITGEKSSVVVIPLQL